MYKPGCFVVLDSFLLPVFGEIKDIIVFGVDRCFFVMQMYETNCFLSHYHAYDISSLESNHVYSLTDFVDYHPLCSHTLSNNKTIVTLKYHILESM